MKIYILLLLSLLFMGCAIDNNKLLVNNTYKHDVISQPKCNWIIAKDGAWLPDPVCSPGVAFPFDTIQINGKYALLPGKVIVGDICVPGYSSNIRKVTPKTSAQVYNNYGVVSRVTGEYEMDHIISLELGGTNDIGNLYPQPAIPKPGFHEKDKVENCFHRMICKGELDIVKAQHIISTDWTEGLKICNIVI